MNKLTVNELFSGIGSQRKALEKLGIDHEVVGIAEIDKYSISSYEAMFGKTRNYGDISKIEKMDYADLWTYSFPCQDISVAGKQAGIKEGTRSGLLYQVQRLLEIAKTYNELPKYLMLENVKNLVGKQFKPQFDAWVKWLDDIGYNTYWQILNAKNYGIPQNRERVFGISIRKDIDDKTFEFPKSFDNGTRLKDMLEDDVNEKYYLSDYHIEKILNWKAQQKPFKHVNGNNSIYPTLTARGAGEYHSGMITYSDMLDDTTDMENILKDKKNTNCIPIDKSCNEPGFIEIANCITAREDRGVSNRKKEGTAILEIDSENIDETNRMLVVGNTVPSGHTAGRIFNTNGISPTVMERHSKVVQILDEPKFRIRKLTPLECWRLMGFDDEDFFAAMIGARESAIKLLHKYPNHYGKHIMTEAERIQKMSNAQLYKQAGNSIVVNVLCELFAKLFNVNYITDSVQREREREREIV